MLKQLTHVNVWVNDQDEALAFYTEKLGMELREDVTVPELGNFRWLSVGVPGQEEVAVTLMAIGTTMRRSSRRGATRRTSLCPWKRCGKPRAGSRPASPDARAWFTPLKNQADGSSCKLSASEWISPLGMSGMARNHAPGSSPSAHAMESMEPRCAKCSTDAVIQHGRALC